MVDFFFFKKKTAYEMRISDWSSDVCSSDLIDFRRAIEGNAVARVGDEHQFARRIGDPRRHRIAVARVEVGAVDRQCEVKGNLLALGGETLARKRPRRRIGQADVVELHLHPAGRGKTAALA